MQAGQPGCWAAPAHKGQPVPARGHSRQSQEHGEGADRTHCQETPSSHVLHSCPGALFRPSQEEGPHSSLTTPAMAPTSASLQEDSQAFERGLCPFQTHLLVLSRGDCCGLLLPGPRKSLNTLAYAGTVITGKGQPPSPASILGPGRTWGCSEWEGQGVTFWALAGRWPELPGGCPSHGSAFLKSRMLLKPLSRTPYIEF